jgi:2,4-dienoyl-CoA reductase (NADPH2)
MPTLIAKRTYQSLIASGRRTFLNFLGFRYALTRPLVAWLWSKSQPFYRSDGTIDHDKLEGFAAPDAKAIKAAVKIPVLLTGGFQTAHGIGKVLRGGACDAVTIARPLLANPHLPRDLAAGWDGPQNPPCTYCNQCLLHVIENPLGCYDETRFDGRGGREAMLREVFEIFNDYQEPRPDGPSPV